MQVLRCRARRGACVLSCVLRAHGPSERHACEGGYMFEKPSARAALVAIPVAMLLAAGARAGVAPEQAAALGSTLTPVGAEMAGNASGTIPAFTGGLRTAPAGYKGDGHRIDPFADEQ